jgi:integrase
MSRKIPDTITEEELIKILKKTKLDRHKLAFALGFYQCLRISEVVNLQPEHVDKARKLLYIKQAKGKKDRHIPIAPEVFRGLTKLPVRCGVRALQIAFKSFAIKVLNKDLHFHTLRHSGATHYLNKKKWDVRQLQVFLGHSKINITEIYTHVNPQNLVEKMWND